METSKTEVIVSKNGATVARYVVEPGEYLIGRHPDCPILVQADLVSRRHARLIVNDHEMLVEDLGSANGTLIDGQLTTGTTRLLPNEKVTVGTATLEFHRVERDTAAAAHSATVRHLLPKEFLQEKKYDIGQVIARGGMGAILDAREATTERTVAMKVMLDSATDQDLARFVNEAKITGQLEHPNIVPVHELGVDENDQVFYTMKMVRGITLKKVLDLLAAGQAGTRQKYPLAQLLTVFQKVCDAVGFAHSKGVIHRDLKPENIMIGDFGEVLVMDWGLAKVVEATRRRVPAAPAMPMRSMIRAAHPMGEVSSTMAGAILGTPQYMSPEQANGEVETLDARSDIYSLGAILYHLLTLHPPVRGRDVEQMLQQIRAGTIIPPRKAAPVREAAGSHLPGGRVPESLEAVTMKALALKPGARYASVAALQHDIEAFQNGFATGAEHAGFAKQCLLLIRRQRGLAAALALVFALLVAFLGHVLASKRSLAASMRELKQTAPTFEAQAQALVERAPGNPAALAEALENIGHALELAPEVAGYHFTKGCILQTMQRLDEARASFSAALKRNPRHWPARENLQLCEELLRRMTGGGGIGSDGLARLQEALQRQGRVAESLVLLHSLGKDRGRLAATWQAVLRKAGIDRRLTSLEDGSLALDLSGLPIDSLAFLQGMPLSDLSLRDTKINDLSPLAGAPLRRLICTGSNVADLTPLRGSLLQELATGARVAELASLRGLPIERLDLTGAIGVKDWSVLRELPLKRLTLAGTRLSDLSALAGLKLESLAISGTAVTNLSVLKTMPLEEFHAERCPELRDLGPLAGRPLKIVRLADSPRIADLSPLQEAPLSEVDASGTSVNDLRPLARAPLTTLKLARTPFGDASQLGALSHLEVLALNETTVSTLAPLAETAIQFLDLRGCTRLGSVAALAKLSTLKSVALPVQARDVDALRAVSSLQWVGYNAPPAPPELAARAKETAEFWKMLETELQLRAADAKGRLRPSQFRQMARRFPGARQFGGQWYYVFPERLSWTAARQLAEDLGGHLATLTDHEESERVRREFGASLAGSAAYWLGGRTDSPKGKWQWVTGEPWAYENWGRDAKAVTEPSGTSPNGQSETALALARNAAFANNPAWNDLHENASNVVGAIIEWDD